jgi:GMP synthase-like glutamine amidotransferase
MSAVLVLNSMKDDRLAETFNWAISRVGKKAGKNVEFCRISKDEKIPDLNEYTHLILSGSEASVLDNNPWEPGLEKTVKTAIDNGIPVLGICYGHQFLGRILQGRHRIGKSKTPEFGWLKIKTKPNPLFDGIEEPVCMVSHFDEVTEPAAEDTGDLKVIAATPRCPVHSFQYKELPVWGIQFHPEYNFEEGDEIFEVMARKDPDFQNKFFDSQRNEVKLEENEKILLNFLNT